MGIVVSNKLQAYVPTLYERTPVLSNGTIKSLMVYVVLLKVLWFFLQ